MNLRMRTGCLDHVETAWILGERAIKAQMHAQELHQQYTVDAVVSDHADCAAGLTRRIEDLEQALPGARGETSQAFAARKHSVLRRGHPHSPQIRPALFGLVLRAAVP